MIKIYEKKNNWILILKKDDYSIKWHKSEDRNILDEEKKKTVNVR